MPRISVSSWSLHRLLGSPRIYGVEDSANHLTAASGHEESALLELPSRLASFGITTLELCHFHLPSRDADYLTKLRAALDEAGVELFSLLVDDGDITHPTNGDRDLAWIMEWIEVADQLGARCVRVIAGKQLPTDEAMERSRAGLEQLARRADNHGIRLMTENWFDLLSDPLMVHRLLDSLENKVGLCLDFGNWSGADKYQALAQIASRAESCHAKASFGADYRIDREDFQQCLELMRAAEFAGPYTLIYSDDRADEWKGLGVEKEIVTPYL